MAPPAARDDILARATLDSLYDTLLSSDTLGWLLEVNAPSGEALHDLLASSDITAWALDSAAPVGQPYAPRISWPVGLVDTGSAAHGYVPYDAISTTGATDPAFNAAFPDGFVIVGVENTRFRYRLTNRLLAANIATANPGTTCTCSKIIHRLDEALRAASANAIIRPLKHGG